MINIVQKNPNFSEINWNSHEWKNSKPGLSSQLFNNLQGCIFSPIKIITNDLYFRTEGILIIWSLTERQVLSTFPCSNGVCDIWVDQNCLYLNEPQALGILNRKTKDLLSLGMRPNGMLMEVTVDKKHLYLGLSENKENHAQFTIDVLDRTNNKWIKTIQLPDNITSMSRLYAHGNLIYVVHAGHIDVLDCGTGGVVNQWKTSHSNTINTIQIYQELLYTNSEDSLKIWTLQGQLIKSYEYHPDFQCRTFVINNNKIYLGTSNNIHVYEFDPRSLFIPQVGKK